MHLVAVVVATHGYIVNERAEHLVWQSLLESELAHFTRRHAVDPNYRLDRYRDIQALRAAERCRASTRVRWRCSPGVHDEVRARRGLYVALVRPPANGGDVLALDIYGIEQRERTLTLTMAVSTAAVACGARSDHAPRRRLARRPLTSIARAIASLAPNRAGQRIDDRTSSRRSEAEIIAVAHERLPTAYRGVRRARTRVRQHGEP